jgi:hypothetical protein
LVILAVAEVIIIYYMAYKYSRSIIRVFFMIFFICPGSPAEAGGQSLSKREGRLEERVIRRLDDIQEIFAGWHHAGEFRIDSLRVDSGEQIISIWFNPQLTHIPLRFPWIEKLRFELANRLGYRFRNYHIDLYSRGDLLEYFIPNYYRENYLRADTDRIAKPVSGRRLVAREDGHEYEGGLTGSHIAVWPSHGYHYDAVLDRWEWQRARLHGTIEDIYTYSYTHQYLVPMLENAGAYVLMPRERDIQPLEVILDNDGSSEGSEVIIRNGPQDMWETVTGGFAMKDTLFEGENPFRNGTHLRIRTTGFSGPSLSYIPDIPEDGHYAVYISWAFSPDNISKVKYSVIHSGGKTDFNIDQTMGAGTWIYLGTFHFMKGKDIEAGSLLISGNSSEMGFITADAVRFGGGMGNVARKPGEEYVPPQWSLYDGQSDDMSIRRSLEFRREPSWKTSGRPRYMEGARYYLQYSGMPDSTVYSINRGRNDYNDDFMSRGEWVNFLMGAPMEVTGKPAEDSPRIPIDLVLAFHTDAGVTPNDSVIGTLAIYSSERNEGVYYNGQSRMAGRDLADIVQSQIVSDIRMQVNDKWTRRGLWDRQYSEAWRPHAPAMLLELLSHQNLADLSYGLDPRFRFLVSRAIYKGILRYLAYGQGREAIIQPLPPVQMSVKFTGENRVRLSWEDDRDPLEPTAVADYYKVYMSTGQSGFDNGIVINDRYTDISLADAEDIYNFRVTAINGGGESMPGETLSVSSGHNNKKPVLIVNAFTRLSGPAIFDTGELAGIAWWEDNGVADRYELNRTGNQYDFQRSSLWLDDDSPGWGASYAGMEGKIIKGNSFDFPLLYGRALKEAGYSFVSTSKKAFESGIHDPENFTAVIMIFGKERGQQRWKEPWVTEYRVFTPAIIDELQRFAEKGGNIFISGAYTGTDMVENNDSMAMTFARDILGFTWRSDFATTSGDVYATDQCPPSFPHQLTFNSDYDSEIYTVEAPDAIEPAGDDAWRIYRYSSGNTSAGILKNGHHRAVVLGFPFETIVSEQQRHELMRQVMRFFEINQSKIEYLN